MAIKTIGAPFQANTTTLGVQSAPDVVALTGGGFAVVWQDDSQLHGDASGSQIQMQVFSASGQKVGSEIRVNTTTAGSQIGPEATALPDGGLMVIWKEPGAVSGTQAIRAQVIGADGNLQGGEILVAALAANSSGNGAVSVLPNGNIVIGWSEPAGPSYDSKVQVFRPDGSAATGVQTVASGEFLTDLEVLTDGTILVGTSEARHRLDGSGNPIGSPVVGSVIDIEPLDAGLYARFFLESSPVNPLGTYYLQISEADGTPASPKESFWPGMYPVGTVELTRNLNGGVDVVQTWALSGSDISWDAYAYGTGLTGRSSVNIDRNTGPASELYSGGQITTLSDGRSVSVAAVATSSEGVSCTEIFVQFLDSRAPKLQVVSNPDGSQALIEQDIYNQFSWSVLVTYPNSTGTTTKQVLTNDDTTHTVIEYDAQGGNPWSTLVTYADPNWVTTKQVLNYDTGAHAIIEHDTQDQFNWSRLISYSDANWNTTQQILDNDDGTHVVIDYDTQGQQIWSSLITYKNSSWATTVQVINNDDGTHDVATFDANQVQTGVVRYTADWLIA